MNSKQFRKSIIALGGSIFAGLALTSCGDSNNTRFIGMTERPVECTYLLNGEEKNTKIPSNIYVKIKDEIVDSNLDTVQVEAIVPIEHYGEDDPCYEYIEGCVDIDDLIIAEIPEEVYKNLDMEYCVSVQRVPESELIGTWKNPIFEPDINNANLRAIENGAYVLGSRELKEDPGNYRDLDYGYKFSTRFVMIGYFNKNSGDFEVGYIRDKNAKPISLLGNEDLWERENVNAILDLSNEEDKNKYKYEYGLSENDSDIIISDGTKLCVSEMESKRGNVLASIQFENEYGQIVTFYLTQEGIATMIKSCTEEVEELIKRAKETKPIGEKSIIQYSIINTENSDFAK